MPKKNNKIKNTFQVYGYNNCFPVLNQSKYEIINTFILEDKKSFFSNKIDFQKHHDSISFLKKNDFYKKFDNLRSQGIVVSFKGPVGKDFSDFDKKETDSCLLILDRIEDPQNAGQIIRTAECAGIDGIIFPSHNSFRISNTIINISQGAFVSMPLYEVTNISSAILELKKNDFWIIGIENSIGAKSWDKLDYSGNTAIVVGSEGKGIRAVSYTHLTLPTSYAV